MADPRIAAVLTTGRQDYGILRSTPLCLRNNPSFELRLLVSRRSMRNESYKWGKIPAASTS